MSPCKAGSIGADCSGKIGIFVRSRFVSTSTIEQWENSAATGLVNDFGGVKRESGATQTRLVAHFPLRTVELQTCKHSGSTPACTRWMHAGSRCESPPFLRWTWTIQVTHIVWAGYHCASIGLGKGTAQIARTLCRISLPRQLAKSCR